MSGSERVLRVGAQPARAFVGHPLAELLLQDRKELAGT